MLLDNLVEQFPEKWPGNKTMFLAAHGLLNEAAKVGTIPTFVNGVATIEWGIPGFCPMSLSVSVDEWTAALEVARLYK